MMLGTFECGKVSLDNTWGPRERQCSLEAKQESDRNKTRVNIVLTVHQAREATEGGLVRSGGKDSRHELQVLV